MSKTNFASLWERGWKMSWILGIIDTFQQPRSLNAWTQPKGQWKSLLDEVDFSGVLGKLKSPDKTIAVVIKDVFTHFNKAPRKLKNPGGGVLQEFLGGDVPLALWNP